MLTQYAIFLPRPRGCTQRSEARDYHALVFTEFDQALIREVGRNLDLEVVSGETLKTHCILFVLCT